MQMPYAHRNEAEGLILGNQILSQPNQYSNVTLVDRMFLYHKKATKTTKELQVSSGKSSANSMLFAVKKCNAVFMKLALKAEPISG